MSIFEEDGIIDMVKELDLPYQEKSVNKKQFLYVYDKGITELKKQYPNKYTTLFPPYLRLSYDGKMPYEYRFDGVIGYVTKEKLSDMLNKLV